MSIYDKDSTENYYLPSVERIKKLEATVFQLTELLKEIEWSATIPYHIPACPSCLQSQEDGHADNCKLEKKITK